MTADIRVPEVRNAGEKLSLGRWFKREGDPVSLDEPLAEISTDNVSHEICAPTAGVLTSILRRDGQSVVPGTVIGKITQF